MQQLRLCLVFGVFGKFKGNSKGKKIEREKVKEKKRKIKNRVKDDKLFLFVILNLYYLF